MLRTSMKMIKHKITIKSVAITRKTMLSLFILKMYPFTSTIPKSVSSQAAATNIIGSKLL
jgi:hypothetical protein